MTPEGKLARYLVRRCKELGFEQRKLGYEGRVGAPDRLVLAHGVHVFIELKAPGEKPTRAQLAEHERLRHAGCWVAVVDNPESLDVILGNVRGWSETNKSYWSPSE